MSAARARRASGIIPGRHTSGLAAPYTNMGIATDLDAKELPPGLTLSELHAKLNGHTKGAAGLVGKSQLSMR